MISSEFMNEDSPIRMVSTDHATFQEPGWKLLTAGFCQRDALLVSNANHDVERETH